MKFIKLVSKIKRVYTLGLWRVGQSLYYKIRQKYFITKWKARAIANATCSDRPASLLSHKDYLSLRGANRRSNPFLFTHLKTIIPVFDSSWQQLADQACQDQFDLLGSGLTTLAPLNWHLDFRLAQANPTLAQFPKMFYADITIPKNFSWELGPDIKLPWELSRCQHLPIVGLAWQATGDVKYRDCFARHIESWIQQNPPLMGVNWKNGMEVGIRAVNWIWAAHFFQSADLPTGFWNKFNGSLLDHMRYLEWNWEVYDTITNNHYLSNLLGYLYLCYYFQCPKQANWCLNKFKLELQKQILPDGASYEGSTGYHRLVTEIVGHFNPCAQELGLDVAEIEPILEQMLKFLADCSPGGQLILIGDHDSGRITRFDALSLPLKPLVIAYTSWLLTVRLREPAKPCEASWRRRAKPGVAIHSIDILDSDQLAEVRYRNGKTPILSYPHFGLKILQAGSLHAALRQNGQISPTQPVSHRHNDNGHLIFSVKGQPILIDPGTYVYSSSRLWDDRFRSSEMHNQPNLREAGRFERNINLGEGQLIVTDTIWSNDQCSYRFIFHPQVVLKKITSSLFEIFISDRLIGRWFIPDLELEIKVGYCALQYGQLTSCFWLEGQVRVKDFKELKWGFQLY